MFNWLIWSETEIQLKLLFNKLKKSVVMLISLKKSLKAVKIPWVNKSVNSISNVLVNFVKKLLKCSNLEKTFNNIWKIEWKSSHLISLNLSEKLLLLNLLLTQELWALWPNIQLQLFKFWALKKHFSEL